ncbi:P-loop containing nucleoside triphosphate hydrolase protein [Pisolithus marmoratus]|nr:P-loop containing nucleoside triphosphate hydrolase protein [Pisolithus marmoratus]
MPPPAYTQAHLEATLAASDINRFGEWTILMASSATKDLFQLRRDDAKTAECVLKKIRQLSRGQFSGNNYKMLHGPSHGIPIYQAEVLSNLRLVYQIDCAIDDDGQEVVKVYGIYSYKQLDHIWPRLSKVLNGRGKVYRQRCMLREPAQPGSGVYRPAVFPLRDEEFITEESPIFMREDGSNENYIRLISMVRFFCISRNLHLTLVIGLIAEQEVELPIQLTAKEWQIVRCATSCYVIGRSGTGKTTAMVYKMLGIHRAWVQVPGVRKPRQLFVTRFPVLAAKVEEFFTSLVESLALAGCTQDELRKLRSQIKNTEHQEPKMTDPLNALNYRPGTPQKYSDLSDHDFPLFITFDQAGLARMIAADTQIDNPNSYDRHHFILTKVINDESSFITYDVFRANYWPRLLNTLPRNFGPWLVFSEFMGVIKGSERAFQSPDGLLDRQTYVNLSARTYPVFAEDRHALYNAFELTCTILQALSRNPLKGQTVDYLYVDEVQDNLIIDTMLLRILCSNADGFFWAGDTAQTISAGSSFRFADLKAFIHHTEAEGTLGIQKCCTKPELFELAINYRSHSGIVNCAQSVVKLITDFWPKSIDILNPESAILGGPKPVFFVGSQGESLPYEPFFSGLQGSRELGADQCILVRDSDARDQIKERFGDISMVLTLQESKGLEFDDVFLYNFFEGSTALLSQWRVVFACGSQGLTPSRDVSESPHTVLCTELKNLYVGITRARKNLYLLDHSEKSQPMRELWSNEGLIDVAPSSNLCNYIGESSPEQWAAFGYKLFNAGQFQEAIRCFDRAKLPRQLRIARACRLRQVAILTVRPSERQKAFRAAAQAFVECAGEALGTQKTSFYGDAAKCYASADDFLEAAKIYMDANDFAGAAEQYRKAGHFDKIVQILTRHPEKVTASYRNELLYICVVHYSRNGLRLFRPPVRLFSSTADELKYLEGKGLHKARTNLLEAHGRLLEVAEIQLSLGQLCDAIQTLFRVKPQDNPSAMQRAADIALSTLWRECSFGMPVRDILSNKGSDAHKIRFFRALAESPFAVEIYRLGEEFSDRGEDAMALMAFDVFFSQLPTLHSAQAPQFDNFLRRFERYVRLLVSVVSHEIPFPATDSQVRKVFGIAPLSDHHYSITPGTFLHKRFTQNRHLAADIGLLLNAQLKAHLRQKVLEENISCIARAFSTQCPYFVLHDCHYRTAHCSHQHSRRTSLNATLYNMKVNLHLQQIRILDLMFSVVGEYEDWHAR